MLSDSLKAQDFSSFSREDLEQLAATMSNVIDALTEGMQLCDDFPVKQRARAIAHLLIMSLFLGGRK